MMANSTSIREWSDSLQQMWQALCEIRRSRTNNNTMECKVRKHWRYCMGWIQERTKALWQACTSWENEIVDLSRQYVCGLLPYHPGFEEPIWEETEAIRDGLVSLHEYGLLTQYSEPGKFWRTRTGRETRKLPHLFFTMPTINTRIDEESVRTFIQRLESTDGIWYHVTYHYASHLVPAPSNRAFHNCSDRLFTNLPKSHHKQFCCEQTRKKTAEWEDIGFQYFPGREEVHQGSGGLNDFEDPFQACLAVDPLQVCIVSKDFTTFTDEKQDLPDLVRKLLVQAGFQPLAQLNSDAQDLGDAMIIEDRRNRSACKGVNECFVFLVSLVEEAEREGILLDEADNGRDGTIENESEVESDDDDSSKSMDDMEDEAEDANGHDGDITPEDGEAGQSTSQTLSKITNSQFSKAQAAEVLLLISKFGASTPSAWEEDRESPG